MRTLTGYEAINVAEPLNLLLFDLFYKTDVTVQQAKQFIHQQRNPESFVLENWPETDEEAEQIVLGLYHTALISQQVTEASIIALWQSVNQTRALHPAAAELAAQRLVAQQALEVSEMDEEEPVYRIPRTVHFTDEFLQRVRSFVCEDCAHLNPQKPFHKTCLLALIDFLVHEDFSLEDVTETRAHASAGRVTDILKSGVSTRWLSQTVAATKSRWRSVVKPIIARGHADNPTIVIDVASKRSATFAQQSEQQSADAERTDVSNPTQAEKPTTRDKISKDELIRYLRSVEIVEEDGELADLRAERDQLLKQLEDKAAELGQSARQRAYLEGQVEEMQRDMDTLLQAMQITKRRGHTSAQVIDAEIGGDMG